MRTTPIRFLYLALLATATALTSPRVSIAEEDKPSAGSVSSEPDKAAEKTIKSDTPADENSAVDFDSIRKKLAETVHVSYRGIPLHEVLNDLCRRTRIDIVTHGIDGKTMTASVNLVVNAPVKVVVRQALDQAGGDLDYGIRHGFLLIASREHLDAIHEARVYRYGQQPSLGAAAPVYPAGANGSHPRGEELRQLLSVVEPQSWELGGGQGRVSYINGNLVVWQTPRVHEQIADLFEQLREADEQDTREFEQKPRPTITSPVVPSAQLPVPTAPSTLDGSPR